MGAGGAERGGSSWRGSNLSGTSSDSVVNRVSDHVYKRVSGEINFVEQSVRVAGFNQSAPTIDQSKPRSIVTCQIKYGSLPHLHIYSYALFPPLLSLLSITLDRPN